MTEAALFGDDNPRWSPDGTRIAFSRYTLDAAGSIVAVDIYTVDAVGSAVTHVTSGVEPTWLPDGRIAFRDPYTGSVSIINSDGSNRVTLLSYFDGASLDWSPDGTRIAFGRRGDVWLMNADGGGQTPLTTLGGSAPRWSPDGGTIVFECAVPVNSVNLNICSIHPDGTGFASVTRSAEPERSSRPVFSPDGHRIAFARSLSGPEGAYKLWSMASDGSDQQHVLDQWANSIDWQSLRDSTAARHHSDNHRHGFLVADD
jgi:TolB protein